jgi:UDP-GlcNAc:undecaprenyl-phosphate/decaprenyl-phosphate GlcNAc-1-phosphate transferase
MLLFFATFVTAFVASLCLTPLARRIAFWLDIVDRPDQHRKLHTRTTPLGGGLAVLGAFLIATCAALLFSDSQRRAGISDPLFFAGLLAAAVGICLVGILDDRFTLRGRQKLLGQFLVTLIVVASGLVIHRVDFLIHWDLGLLAVPFTIFFLLGAINAVNLIDGLDGLATSVGIVVSLAVAIMSVLSGHTTEAFLALALAGALLGFLMYNRPPASIFLGDAGSMLIGLLLGALAIRAALKGPTTVALAGPLAVLAIPVFDVSMALLRRWLTGRSLYTTDRGHLHHTLLQRGFSNEKTVAFMVLLCTLTASGAVLSHYFRQEAWAYASVFIVCAILITTRMFGHHECWLLCRHVRGTFSSLVPSLRTEASDPFLMTTRFRGDREWEDLWLTLTEFAERFDLTAIQLNVNLPALGEEYHATWKRREHPAESELWHSDIPLKSHELTVGRLRITGSSNEGGVCSWMGDLIAGLEPFEKHLQALLDDLRGYARRPASGPRRDERLEGALNVPLPTSGMGVFEASQVPDPRG